MEWLVEMPGADWYVAEYYLARVRFGLWNQILAEPVPNPKLPGWTAAYFYSRGCRPDDLRTLIGPLAAGVPPGRLVTSHRLPSSMVLPGKPAESK